MRIDDQGTVVLFIPESDLEYEWLTVNVENEPWQWMGRSLAVDHRYADGLIEYINESGFITESAD